MSSREKPLGQAIVVCDQVITDKFTEKKTLVGTFNNIFTGKFPCSHVQMSIYVALSNGHGKQKISLRCIQVDGSKELFRTEGDVEFDNPNHVFELVFDLRNVNFIQEGLHAFEVHSDDDYVFECRFNLVKIQKTS